MNSWYTVFAPLMILDTASWYSGVELANMGMAPMGMESCVTCGVSVHEGDTSKL